ncbi:hypothetical protein HELRODRAFT_113093 [Helobdella robusta]|uniref:26S proteasome non-ATPase regulatory subunit 2 n=1 Tax=Helobdella robusta TaxID=6412 RepID=T1EFQ2_HELRO|nr:hypothetical protein HELRODRAFT_113093 [Helobdella robusta]ESO00542.1 hypothetical protein HELRODRAFT_113093 [Helobdella robusta]
MADTKESPAAKENKINEKDGVKSDEKEKKTGEVKEQDLTEEDKQLIEELNMLVERLTEPDQSLYRASLESLRTLIRSSTTSMTSVPKPLKFLKPHFETLKSVYDKIVNNETKRFCADVLSVLSMTMSDKRECLHFRLLGSLEHIGSWGHEYVRHLSGEIVQQWQDCEDQADCNEKREVLKGLIHDIIPYLMQHNAEPEACDILMEVELLHLLEQYVDKAAFPRVCLYLKSCVPYVPDPENINLLKTTLGIYRKFEQFSDALLIAIQLNDLTVVKSLYADCKDPAVLKQMACILGQQQIFFEVDGAEEDVEQTELMRNVHLNVQFLNLARELDIMEPKIPEDIYKSHLEPSRPTLGAGHVDSARQNLSASFVNGFVNAGFGKDKLLADDANSWFYKNKDHGMFSAAASLGLILLWDIDGGLAQLDKYLYSKEDPIKAGCLLGCGIVNTGVKNECDPALALLSDYVKHSSHFMKIGSILGLGLAYSGSNREDVIQILLRVFTDGNNTLEVIGVASLACGMIAVGTCNGAICSTILQTLMESGEMDLKDTYVRFLALGLGLLFLGCQQDCEATLAALEVFNQPFKNFAITMVDICAYAGTGNVLKIQKLLHTCSEHYDAKEQENQEPKKDEKNKNRKDKSAKDKEASSNVLTQQAISVLGIALIAMGEDIGVDMSFRMFGHLLRYGEPVIKRAVPLALALISVSNPKLQVIDVLSKFSHDSDPEVAHNAILAMGLVGAGTNNARLATMLRQLAVYHSKDSNNLFCIRIAQGLTHLGKGTLTLCPYQWDRQIMNPVAVAGLMSFLVACLDVKNIILSKSHYLIYTLVTAIHPRMLVTFDVDFNPLPVSVRVGQAVDVVGQAGNPKTITGFQTHTTPVLLAYGERAELATDEYISMTPVMEGFVILRKNENYVK